MEKIIRGIDEIPTKFEVPQIISVVYEDNKEPKKFDTESRTYSYYTQLNLQVGDIVDCPVRKK